MVILGLGSNQGDREGYLRRAVAALTSGNAAVLSAPRLSAVYETPALLPDNAPPEWDIPFLNMAVGGDSALPLPELLNAIKQLEQALGRQERGRWGPREIDIDILCAGDAVLRADHLTVPHPGLLERAFALVPVAEIAPNWRYPSSGEHQGKTARDLAARYTGQTEMVCVGRLER